ncbi:hypothetical protein EV196_101611 [Mariniflexile fucanivorans]|uniref:LPXTG-motif cell wall-anchored protein n=1 Tax=Mariniflexile fucanivorans TaxID=264023 RepID=A0A4V2QES3_9FLAO|nr:hypothetical protein [Mariniflexile fucanivorans]TCL69177.1 hypothetical protein EV196_101611 [Mariniflexile fucanivorans]
MKTKIILLSVFAFVAFNCSKADKNADQSLTKDANQTSSNVLVSVKNQDSINFLNSKLNLLGAEKDGKTKLVNMVSKQRDSLQALLAQLETSVKAINDKKLSPGIAGVNSKLDQLKGQKENLQEQIALQKKEVALATKKVDILNEEKAVYQDQKKALYDKGAPPVAFKVVDSLLNGINSQMLIQNDVVKNINRNVADAEEQMLRITGQRDELSKKIRNNYDTQLILSEYNSDEKNRLDAQLAKVNENLNMLLNESSILDTDYKLLAAKLSNLNTPTVDLSKIEGADNAETADSDEESGKSSFALIVVLALGVIMAIFYVIGKRRKNKNIKK